MCLHLSPFPLSLMCHLVYVPPCFLLSLCPTSIVCLPIIPHLVSLMILNPYRPISFSLTHDHDPISTTLTHPTPPRPDIVPLSFPFPYIYFLTLSYSSFYSISVSFLISSISSLSVSTLARIYLNISSLSLLVLILWYILSSLYMVYPRRALLFDLFIYVPSMIHCVGLLSS